MIALLRERKISFAMIGAGAMAAHGVSRATRDLDLLVVSADCLREDLWDGLRAEGFDVAVRRGDSDDPLAGVVRVASIDAHPIDLVVGRSPWQSNVFTRALEAEIEGTAVPVATRLDLILLKLYAGSPQDAWDIERILDCDERASLIGEVEKAIEALPHQARVLWERIVGTPSP